MFQIHVAAAEKALPLTVECIRNVLMSFH